MAEVSEQALPEILEQYGRIQEIFDGVGLARILMAPADLLSTLSLSGSDLNHSGISTMCRSGS